MAKRSWRDETGELKKVFNKVMEREPKRFAHLKGRTFNFVFKDPPDTADNYPDGITLGTASTITAREHDIYGPEFQITIAADPWQHLDTRGKYRLMWHEMNHCQVEMEEDETTPKRDSVGRVKTYVQPHDLVIEAFSAEIERFGIHGWQMDIIQQMLNANEEYKKRQQKLENKDSDTTKVSSKKKKNKKLTTKESSFSMPKARKFPIPVTKSR